MHSTIRPLLFVLLVTYGCHDPRARSDALDDGDLDGGLDGDSTGADGEVRTDGSTDADVSPDVGPGDARTVPECGNGLLDEGEECDDGNRLNGDGCDWVCRLGDGEDRPSPDLAVPDYVPEGPSESIETMPSSEFDWFVPIPLVWTGEELATAIWETPGGDLSESRVRFRRFDASGTSLRPDWIYPVEGYSVSMDLVWHGAGFGFFWVSQAEGIYFLALDRQAKPIGRPRLVVEEERVQALSATASDSGYLLVWSRYTDRERRGCFRDRVSDAVEVWGRIVARDGAIAGLLEPVLIHDSGWGLPDVAGGEGGYGLAGSLPPDDDYPRCSVTFLLLDDDLTVTRSAHRLSDGGGGQVQYIGGRYILGWTPYRGEDAPRTHLCFSQFDEAGWMTSMPICEVTTGRTADSLMGPVFSAGDRGLLVLFVEGAHHHQPTNLYHARTDLRGSLSGRVGDLAAGVRGAGVTWMDESFGVLHLVYEGPYEGSLSFTRFVPSGTGGRFR